RSSQFRFRTQNFRRTILAEKPVSKFAPPGHWPVPTVQPRALQGEWSDHRVTRPRVAQGYEFPTDAVSKECVLFLWRVRFVWRCTLANRMRRRPNCSRADFIAVLIHVQVNIFRMLS